MTGPAQHLRTLELLLNGGNDSKSLEAKGVVTQLRDSLRALSRIAEFNTDDSYFEWRTVDLAAWLRSMTDSIFPECAIDPDYYRIKRGTVRPNSSKTISCSTFCFGICGKTLNRRRRPCEITVHINLYEVEAELLITDNGSGFSPEYADLAFVEQFSSLGSNRGRGLLEVRDAVRRLGGTIDLFQNASNEYRIRIRVPILK